MSSDKHDMYHITPSKTYFTIYGILIVLTVITVGASLIHLGHWNTPLAMFIATIKATLVAAFFMHQKYERSLNRLIFVSGFIFLLIFVGFTGVDILTRVAFSDLKFGGQ